VLSAIPRNTDPRVLVDYRTADDAGVYAWEGGPALVQTVDFFTPIVDDPYTYGQIAAANAVSDIYAMGGRPLTALAIAGFPEDLVDADTIRAVFRGGHDKLQEAGTALLGGHTVRDREIKFGYAVTGAVDPKRMLTNAGAQPGDVLILTKPLGTGIVGTAIKFGRAPADLVQAAVASMRTLNKAAAEALAAVPGAHACTDITGYGLLGHGSEMSGGSGVTLELHANVLPVFPGVRDLIAANRSGGLESNREHFAPGVEVQAGVPEDLIDLAYDPQTSGGLLVAVDPAHADQTLSALRSAGVAAATVIGKATAKSNMLIRLSP
jgi:selenide,water dikinase